MVKWYGNILERVVFMSKRILFIISDTGGGHRSAANAIAASLTRLDPEIRFEMVDLLRASRLPGIRNAPEIYAFFSANSIWLYNLMYRLANYVGFMNLASKFLYQFARAHIHQTIEGFKPDLLVVIHPLAVRPICDYRDETSATWPIVTVVTDLVSIHASWASDRSDHYLLPTSQAVNRLLQLGVAKTKLQLTGFPVHPRFLVPLPDRITARQVLGLPPDRFTVLLTSGGAGGGQVAKLVEAFERHCPECILLVVTGRNARLYEKLTRRTVPKSSRIYQFVDNMEELMSACDIVVTKAGPGTIMETATLGKPLILTGAVGLQEQGNIGFVTEAGLGVFCPNPVKAAQAAASMRATQREEKKASMAIPVCAGTVAIAETLLTLLCRQAAPISQSSLGEVDDAHS
jgi:UDP-N-acetylglucosamine:LPS N-acetylglucosamine transferase